MTEANLRHAMETELHAVAAEVDEAWRAYLAAFLAFEDAVRKRDAIQDAMRELGFTERTRIESPLDGWRRG